MKKSKRFSFKQLQIDKATTSMVVFIAIATALFIFSLVACRALLAERSHLAEVISQKEKAKKQLQSNIQAKNTLVSAYQQFVNQPQNIIGGNPNGQGENDGDNARIILDALPSKYDFPALTTSLEKLLADPTRGLTVQSINGTDDEIAQGELTVDNPSPVEMPFELTVLGDYTAIQDLVTVFQRSIRPFHIKVLTLSGADTEMTFQVTAKTYYQPEKKVKVEYKDVR